MSNDHAEGIGHKIVGAVKEGIGKLTGDEKLQAEGMAEKTGGSVQSAMGKAEDHMHGDNHLGVDHDRVEGSGKKFAGSIKEGIGNLTGDEKLKAEGKADQATGTVQNAFGGAKDAVRDTFRK